MPANLARSIQMAPLQAHPRSCLSISARHGPVCRAFRGSKASAKERRPRDFRVVRAPDRCEGGNGSAGPVEILDCFDMRRRVEVSGLHETMRGVAGPSSRNR